MLSVWALSVMIWNMKYLYERSFYFAAFPIGFMINTTLLYIFLSLFCHLFLLSYQFSILCSPILYTATATSDLWFFWKLCKNYDCYVFTTFRLFYLSCVDSCKAKIIAKIRRRKLSEFFHWKCFSNIPDEWW